MLLQTELPHTPSLLNLVGKGERPSPSQQFRGYRAPSLFGANRKDRRRKRRWWLPSGVERERSPSHGENLDRMGREPGVPKQGITFDGGGKGPVSKQEVNPTRDRRPAANACRLGADVGPFGGDKGIEAVELLKFHIEVAPDEAGDPTRAFRIQ